MPPRGKKPVPPKAQAVGRCGGARRSSPSPSPETLNPDRGGKTGQAGPRCESNETDYRSGSR